VAPKILHVEAGRHLHGGAQQVLYLLAALAERGFDNILVCPRGSAVAREAADIARVCTLPWHGEADLLAPLRLLRLVRTERPALLHAHSRRGADWFTALVAAGSGVPAVVSRRVDNRESGPLVRWKYRRYAAVIAISAAIERMLEQTAGLVRHKLHLVHSAVDAQQYRPAGDRAWLAAEFELDADAPILAMVAQFIPRKGHQVLLAALPAIWQRHPAAQFLLFGEGGRQAVIAAEVRRQGWQARVRLPGHRPDMARILPALDALVHPAHTEGLGVALLEAGACGVPVIAAAAGGIPEVIVDEHTGLLVRPGDAHGLAEAVVRLLDSPSLAQRLGLAARARVESAFSVAAMADAHATLYRQLLAPGGR
jgi:glycosyltransferase involved in cell wall biosynthesis